jgi:medium-chain acyl-[acyl-carrier-protein] hydrolase
LARRAPQLASGSPPAHQLADAELINWMRDLGGTPELLLEHPELLPIFLPILRADLTLHESYVYQPEPPLNLPITAFCGLGDSQASRAEMAAWREQSSAAYGLRLYPGDHFFLKSYLTTVLGDVSAVLTADMGE